MKRNSGKAYVTSKGKFVPEKTFSNPPCNCKMKCSDSVIEEQRKTLFDKFYIMASFKTQNAYISGLCQQGTPKVHRVRDGSRGVRGTTISYHIQLPDRSLKVCKQYFLKTFQISDGRCFRALKKVRNGQEPGSDLRGKQPPPNKINEACLQIVRDHIENFPAYQSHYTRAHNPNRKYLSEHLNIRLMYNLYKEHCTNINTNPVSESKYRYILNFEYNLHFHSPHKDTCSKCDDFKMKIDCCEDPIKNKSLKPTNRCNYERLNLPERNFLKLRMKAKKWYGCLCSLFTYKKHFLFPL